MLNHKRFKILSVVLLTLALVVVALVIYRQDTATVAAQDPAKEQQAKIHAQQFLAQHPPATTTQSQQATVSLTVNETLQLSLFQQLGWSTREVKVWVCLFCVLLLDTTLGRRNLVRLVM